MIHAYVSKHIDDKSMNTFMTYPFLISNSCNKHFLTLKAEMEKYHFCFSFLSLSHLQFYINPAL